jgi:Uma2 family endonuclease
MTQTRLLTAEDLLALGDDCHCELVEGQLVPLHGEGDGMSPASHVHGRVASRFDRVLGTFIDAHRLGRAFAAETGFRLRRDPDTVRAPDFAFVARGRISAAMETTAYLDLAPDLVVEVVSPGDRPAAVAKKVREYLDAGVRLVLVAYPDQPAVVVYRPGRSTVTLRADDVFSGEDVLPGFTCRVAEFFPALFE